MFNSYRISNSYTTQVVEEVTKHVHEHRAPTDASIRLLNEMEDKARRNIIAKVQINDNTLNGVGIVYADQTHTMAKTGIYVSVKFSINRTEYTFEKVMHRFEISTDKWLMRIIEDYLRLKVAEMIFHHLKIDIIEQLSQKNASGLRKELLQDRYFKEQ